MEMVKFYDHTRKIAAVRALNSESGAALMDGCSTEEKQAVIREARRFVTYAARMKEQYQWAAWFPWLPFSPAAIGSATEGPSR